MVTRMRDRLALWRKRNRLLVRQGGFTLVELLVVMVMRGRRSTACARTSTAGTASRIRT
jgi:type II secretory pathway pseudopilin PulG